MNNKRLVTGVAVTLAQAVAAVSAVQAQTSLLEEIVVTAERRESTLQETDISMTVFTSETLRELGVARYRDISEFTPNLLIQEQPARAGFTVSMRGFRQGETVANFEPKAALYVDGVLIAKSPGSGFDVLDLERIEVLRGPQGTLYGRNTVGGAINLITKKPHDELSGMLSATIGDFGQKDIRGNLNLPLVGPNGAFSDSSDVELNLKVNLASLNRDGYWDNGVPNAPDELGTRDRGSAFIQLQLVPNDRASILYTFSRSEIDEIPWPNVATATINPDNQQYVITDVNQTLFHNEQDFLEGKDTRHTLTIDYEINDNLSLVSVSAYTDNTFSSLMDPDGTPFLILHSAAAHDITYWTQEVRLVGNSENERLEYVFGGFYMDDDLKDLHSETRLASGDSIFTGSGDSEVWAVFGEATYSFTEKLDVTFGLRYTDEKKELVKTDGFFLKDGTPIFETPFPKGEAEFDDVSGTLSLTYQWTDDIMTYAKVSKGYVTGGFNPRAPSPATWIAGYDEEVVWSYELGWKATWLDNRLLINGAIFYNDFQDLQTNRFDPETARQNIANAGDAEIIGLELDFVARPIENLEIGGGYGYLDPEYKTFIDPNTGEDITQNFGWAAAPDNSLNLYGRYTVPDIGGGDLVFRVDYSNQDGYQMLPANARDGINDENGYDLWNARVSWVGIEAPGGGNITVSVWGKNLGEETYKVAGFDLTSFNGNGINSLGAPRTYGVDFTFEF